MKQNDPFAGLNDEQLQLLHSQSESFERALRSGQQVSIESILESIPEDLHPPVFCELFAIEVEWLKSHSASPDVEGFLTRFPSHHGDIHRILVEEKSHSSAVGSGAVGAHQSVVRYLGLPTVGSVIDGRYTITEPIGEGGMGAVFLADQHHPVARKVAIKFVKGGLDSQSVLARFDIERQALAMMDHTGIASVFDGGQTPEGLPYFVMEWVQGVPVTHYCDQGRLDIRSRLKLFVSICNAVQHAHLKGIIHRDLKPGNILVSEIDGQPVAKVIDFGVAKATGQEFREQSLAASLMIMGTPVYMSPEQSDPNSMDIDTRTDVYALGVVLFELLVGSPPYETTGMPRAAIHDVLRNIREKDSPRPSTKVNSALTLSNIASNRSIEAGKLAPSLRGDLDWIALRALEKDRNRRYETVHGLARDVERYLAGEMVEARPPSSAYRMRKFVSRNRGMVVAASLLFLTLTSGIIGTAWGMLVAQKHANLAQLEVIEKEAALENEARERKYAEAISDFVESDFLALTTLEGRIENNVENSSINKDSTLHDLLDRAAEKLNARADLEPRIEARLRSIIGQSYLRLGVFQNARNSFERSVELYTTSFGKDDLGTLTAQDGLADAMQSNGQHVLAQPLLKDTIARKKSLLGLEHDETLKSMSLLARNYWLSGNPAKAVEIIEESLAVTRSKHGPKDRRTLVGMYDLALALNHADKPDEAMSLLEQTLPLQTETLGESHPEIIASAEKLAELYCKFGQFKKAQPLLEKGLDWSKANYGDEDPNTIYAMSRLAGLYRHQRKLDLALPLSQQILELTKNVFGSDHPNVSNAMSDLAMTYRAAKDHDKALPLFKETLEARKASVGVRHPGTLIAMANVAACLRSLGKLDQSQEMNEECLKLAKEVLGENHSQTISIKQNLAVGYWSAKDLDRSLPLFEEVLSYWEARSGRSHPKTLSAIANVGVNYRDAGRLDESVALLEEVFRAVPKNPSLGVFGAELLDAYLQAGQTKKGLALLNELIADARGKFPAESLKLATALALMGKILLKSKASNEAEPLLRESVKVRQQLAPNLWSTYDTVGMLGETQLLQHREAEGKASLVTAFEGMKRLAATAPSNGNDRRAKIIEKLIEAARTLSHPDDIAKWEAELASLQAESTSKK